MKMKTWILPLSVAVVLSACGTAAPSAPKHRHGGGQHHGHEHRGHEHGQGRHGGQRNVERFVCDNGVALAVRQLDNDRVQMRVSGKHAVLKAAVSGSGERYTADQGLFGHGGEWHRKGNEAFFSFKGPNGNTVETACRAVERPAGGRGAPQQ